MRWRDVEEEPYRFDFLALLRTIERSHPDLPRIGDSARLEEEYVRLGQDPHMDFPASTISRVERRQDGTLAIYQKFLGLLGGQGALPLSTTHEAYQWHLGKDDAFPRFLDIINHRFLQLFFRAWADSRPEAHHDRPEADRFADYIGSTVGLGTPPYRNLDTVADEAKLGLAGLLGSQMRSAARLEGFLRGLFGCSVKVEEFVGTTLTLAPGEQIRLGARLSSLGSDTLIGGTVYSVQDKFRVRLVTRSLADYERFLPAGELSEPLADAVTFFAGTILDWDVELAIPERETRGTQLGSFGRLGWTTWMSPDREAPADRMRSDARYRPRGRLDADTMTETV